jgi:hypothetical protein
MAPMKAAYPRVGFADLEKWPEDGRRYELYDGEVSEVPSPFPLHQIVSAKLYRPPYDRRCYPGCH